MQAIATPTVTVSAQKYVARPGEIFPVEYTVSWEGAAGACTVLPPALPSLDWGQSELLEMRSRSQGECSETRLLIGYSAEEPGTYETPAFDIRVLEWPEGAPASLATITPETPALILSASSVTFTVRSSRLPVILIAGVLTVLVAGALLVWRMRRNRSAMVSGQDQMQEHSRDLLHQARRHRLDGDYYAFYRVLRQACDVAERLSDDSTPQLCARLDKRIKDTGYRGMRPTEDELEGDFKDVEQLMARLHQRLNKETE